MEANVVAIPKLHPSVSTPIDFVANGQTIRERLSQAVASRQKHRLAAAAAVAAAAVGATAEGRHCLNKEPSTMVVGGVAQHRVTTTMPTVASETLEDLVAAARGYDTESQTVQNVCEDYQVQEQPLDFSSKKRKRPSAEDGHVKECDNGVQLPHLRPAQDMEETEIRTEGDLLPTTTTIPVTWGHRNGAGAGGNGHFSSASSSISPYTRVKEEEHEKVWLREQYMQMLNSEPSLRSKPPSARPVAPPNHRVDPTCLTRNPMPTNISPPFAGVLGLNGMSLSSNMVLGSSRSLFGGDAMPRRCQAPNPGSPSAISPPAATVNGDLQNPRLSRPFKSYIHDSLSSATPLPIGYFGLPLKMPLVSLHSPEAIQGKETLDSSSLMEQNYFSESYAEFRKQVLSLHHSLSGVSGKRSMALTSPFHRLIHSSRMDFPPVEPSIPLLPNQISPLGHTEHRQYPYDRRSPQKHPSNMSNSGSMHNHSIISPVSSNSCPSMSPSTSPPQGSSSLENVMSSRSGGGITPKTVNPEVSFTGRHSGQFQSDGSPPPLAGGGEPVDSKVSDATLQQQQQFFAPSEHLSGTSLNLTNGSRTSDSMSSTSSAEGVGSATATKRRGRSLPDELKDEAYWERRRKNNEAAKRSRDARRAKEDEIAIRAAFLEQENLKLRVEVASLKSETAKLRCLLYNS